MSWIINFFRLVFILVWTVICAIISFLILLFTFSSDTVLSIVPKKIWSPVVFFLSGVKLEIRGKENIDRENYYIYVSNHASQFDIPATVRAIDVPLYFMLKKELKKVPFLGWYSAAMGMIFVDRKNKTRAKESIKKAGDLIKSGKNVLVYPEGTRSKDDNIHLFRKGAFAISKMSEIGIVPFVIEGSYDILKKGEFLIKPGTITLTIGKPIQYETLRSMNEIEMAEFVRNAVINLKKYN